MAPVLEGKSFGRGPKDSAKTRAPDLEKQESGQGPSYTPTQGRIQLASHESKLVPRKLHPVTSSSIVGLMVFYCKIILTPYVENHNQHD